MSSPSSSTRPQQPVQPAAPARSSVNPVTLLIAAVASAAAAYITSKIWQSGTLIATAMTPVIVALVREALEKPVDAVTTLGAQIAPSRTRASASSATAPRGTVDPTVVRTPDADPTHGTMTVHRTGGLSRRWVRVGLVTGLLAFVIAAVVYTVPELVAGQSAASGSRATSIFGGSSRHHASRTPSTTTTSTEETTPTSTTDTAPTTTQQQETTPTATEEAQPTVTVTTPAPAETVPQATVPETTTPAPDAGTATTPGVDGAPATP